MFVVVIEKISDPSDLGALSFTELEALAREIRAILVETVSRTGGHLAPNLGVVELTIALHLVFRSPEDKIIWDVGHQCYVHKILTGRRERLATIRQFGGLSGFPKTRESVHDCFETGHSSTSISAALGFALARDLNRESHAVVAVIGDGALTGGMSFEAMNHAGNAGTRLIVVLNDNEMSINNNVGALSGYLSRLRTDPFYYKSKDEIEDLLLRIPSVGRRMVKVVERFKDSLKYLLLPGIFFEELGFTYLGPINGHDLKALKQVFERARGVDGPVLVHVCTKKGKGYSPAEKNPDIFHGIGRFDVKTGELIKQGDNPTFTRVFGDCMLRLGERLPKLVAISAAMADGTGLTEFATRFPDRFFDVGIAEQHAVTLAAGLASSGFCPVVAVYSTFLQRAYDQIIHDVALQGLPVIFAVDRAGIVGEDGETHQGIFDLSFLRHIPGLILMAPKDQNELAAMLLSAVDYRETNGDPLPPGAGAVGGHRRRTPLPDAGDGRVVAAGQGPGDSGHRPLGLHRPGCRRTAREQGPAGSRDQLPVCQAARRGPDHGVGGENGTFADYRGECAVGRIWQQRPGASVPARLARPGLLHGYPGLFCPARQSGVAAPEVRTRRPRHGRSCPVEGMVVLEVMSDER